MEIFMPNDFFRLLQGKFRHYAVLPRLRDAIHTSAFKNGLFLLGILAFVQACRLLAPQSVSVSGSSAANGRQLPIYCVPTDQKKVALTFGAAWGNEDTQKILDILKEKNVHATFFMTGGWVKNYPEDVKAILAAGHDLGNHSENHKNMSQLSSDEQKQELLSVHERVRQLTGYEMFLFRPPYGDYDDSVVLTARECGYYPIQWDVDSLDWKDYGTDAILDRVLNHSHLGNGSIILCHNGAKYTAQALERLITGLQEKGYRIVPVSELILREDYHMDAEGRQIPD